MNPFNLHLVADLETALRWGMLFVLVRAGLLAYIATKPERVYVRVKSGSPRPGRGL